MELNQSTNTPPNPQIIKPKVSIRKIIIIAIICVLAVLMNIFFSNFIMKFLRLPLFLDTIFTAAVAFTAGLIPGLIVAVLNWIIPCIYFKSVQFYVLCSIAEVLIICALRPPAPDISNFASKERNTASFVALISKLFLLYVLCAVTVSVLGGIADSFSQLFLETQPLHFSVEDLFKPALIMSNLPSLAVNILSRIPVNIVDRFIVIFGGYLISRLLVKVLKEGKKPIN